MLLVWRCPRKFIHWNRRLPDRFNLHRAHPRHDQPDGRDRTRGTQQDYLKAAQAQDEGQRDRRAQSSEASAMKAVFRLVERIARTNATV